MIARSTLPPGRHHGAPTLTRRIGSFTLTQTVYEPSSTTPWHAHESAAICLVMSGGYRERYARQECHCSKSAVVIRPAGIEHLNIIGNGGAACFIIEPDSDWLAMMKGRLQDIAPLCVEKSRLSWLLRHALAEFRVPDGESAVILEGLAVAALADVQRSGRTFQPAWLARVRAKLHDQPGDRHSLASLAADAGVHPVYLAQSFRRAYGVTIGHYLRGLKVESACRALESNHTILRIALDLGFSSPSHFARVFWKHTGFTPSAYRKQLGKS